MNEIKGFNFSIILIFILLTLVGFTLLPMVPVQFKPNTTKPNISIVFSWGLASPRAVEQEITSLLEGALNTVNGISDIQSESGTGSGHIKLLFREETNMQVAHYEVATLIRNIYHSLPEGVYYPWMSPGGSNANDRPVISYVIISPTNFASLSDLIDDKIVAPLNSLEGVEKAVAHGSQSNQWQVLYDMSKREAAKFQAYQDLNVASYFMTSQSYAVAIQEFEDLYPVLKYDGSFLQHYGKALSLESQPAASNRILQEASLFNNDIFLYTTMGDNHKALKDYENAEKAYQQAINMAPHKFFAPYLLARLHHENGNEEKAANLAEELLKKEVKVPSTAIEEIKQEMKDILTARYPNLKAPDGEKSDAKRKGTGSKEDV